MTNQMLIVFGVLAGAVVLFASGRVRPDVVAILVVLALNLSGVLTIQESLAGFGQPVVVLIAAVSIVGEGLIATGVAHGLGEAVMKAGGSNEARLVALVMVLAGTVGVFMSSSAIVAMFIPVVLAIANKMGLNRKRMLMPLSVDPFDPFDGEGPVSRNKNIGALDILATGVGEPNHLPGVDDRIVAGRHQKHARFVLSGLLVANHGAEHVPGRGIDPARKRPTT